jgi:hypothetical protein
MRVLTVEEADMLAQERPPGECPWCKRPLDYPQKSDDPIEQCTGVTRWHRPSVADWNAGNRESICTWCSLPIVRRFSDPTWRAEDVPQ